MFLSGGAAGGVPPHKGGPKARPPNNEKRGEGSEELENTFGRLTLGRELEVAESLRSRMEFRPEFGERRHFFAVFCERSVVIEWAYLGR